MPHGFEGNFIRQPAPKEEAVSEPETGELSLDGTHTVSVDKKLADNIGIALRMQEKIDEALMTGSRPGLMRMVRMLNCRKSVFAVRGTLSVEEAVSQRRLKQGELTREDREELSGIPDLKDDVEAILGSGRAPVMGSPEDMHIASYFDEHPGDLPATVHVFDVLPRHEQLIVSKLLANPESFTVDDAMKRMSRNHTFLVLGKDTAGNYVCFQKQGPDAYHRFELRELESLINLSVHPSDEQMHLSFIGPVSLTEKDPGKDSEAVN